ncbi:MAG: signal recognition particle-docking protein FtsY [Proteobacteria bacterium]|nr:signal recognition particle-docking protein FtsY [Pseudomonadota bacterium]
MTGNEIAYLLAAFAVVGLFVFFVRRASEKQASARSVRDRLREEAGRDEDRDRPIAEDLDQTDQEREGAYEEQDEGPRPKPPDDEDEERDKGLPGGDTAEVNEASRLKHGLSKTRGGFVARLGRLFSRKKIDDDLLEELEHVLFTADIGPTTAQSLFTALKDSLSRDQLLDPDSIWSKIREESATILSVPAPPLDFAGARPFVLLMIGVNGVGKTTTIGKIAAKLQREGKKVLLAAGDTFRAAAVEQLEIWGERSGAPVVKGKDGSDPSSVIFDAIKRGAADDYDVVICDTAGRLHTKTELMDELKKVGRVCDKALSGAPHETWLILDSTTGQNAIQQAQLFKEAMDITGIVLTKLDGTAKGGVILGICDEMKVPVRYIGIGERIDDLREFEPEAFVAALYEKVDEEERAQAQS